MNVLMVNPSFSGGGYTHNLCNALVDAGCHVELYTGPHFLRASRGWARIAYVPRIRFYRWTQLRSYRSRRARHLWRALRLGGHLWAMTRLLAESSRFDVVHLHFPPLPQLDAWWMAALARRVRLVHTVHNLFPHDAPRTPTLEHALQRIYRSCHALIVHTDFTARGLQLEFGIEPRKIVHLPHGNLSQFLDQRGAPSPQALRLEHAGTPLVLMFGELRPTKGVDVLLRAAALLKSRGLPFRVLIAGMSGPAAEPSLALARQLELGGTVEFRIGYIEEEQVPAYFAAASVVALPYRAIDQSGVAVAAATLGRAIVATRVAGLAELVEGAKNGLLVPVDDPAALADALERVLTNPALRQEFETNSRRYAATALAWGPIAERTLAVYRGQ